MSETPDLLSRELRAMFEADDSAEPLAAATRTRLWDGLEASLATLPPPHSLPSAPLAQRALRSSLATHGLTAAISLIAGGGLGVAVGTRLATSRQIVPTAAPAPVVAPVPPPPREVPAAPPLPAAVPTVPPPRRVAEHRHPKPEAIVPALSQPPKVAAPFDSTAFDRERSLIDTARTALGRGDAEGTLTLLSQYAKEHPHGMLSEESAALRIQALLSSGALGAAQKAADEFRAKYPKSLLLPAIERSLEPQP